MALRITDKCVDCRACLVACPYQAIKWVRGGGGRWSIAVLPSACTHCWLFDVRPQCVEACPVNGIVLDPDQPVPPLHLIREEIERMLTSAGPSVTGHMISRLRQELLGWFADVAGPDLTGIDVEKVRDFEKSLRLLECEFTPAEP